MIDEQQVDALAKKLWKYGRMNQPLEKADAIVVFGSYNPIVGGRAAELYLKDYAPVIIFSGNRSDSTAAWDKTEAETMADVAVKAGVPKEDILLETSATNSGENTRLTRELLEKHGINAKKIIVVQKPYAERRTFATVSKQWPEVEVVMSSPQISYDEYMASSPKGKYGSIDTIVGDTQRIKLYAERDFQIPQEMPKDVWEAYEQLVKLGFTKSLAK